MTRIDPELLSILVCPETRQPLREATADELRTVRDRFGAASPEGGTIDGALLTADGRRAYVIVDAIPDLLPEHAVSLA
jgi:uncharacterized protein YbaR (Trm112 family)